MGVSMTPLDMHSLKVTKHRFTPDRRHARNRDSRLRSLAIEQLCQAFPTGALVLDAQCGVIFSNREGMELLVRWNATCSSDLALAASRSPRIPDEVLAACHSLRHGGVRVGNSRTRPKFGGRIFVPHLHNPNLNAVVALERSARDRRVAIFCVLLQDRLQDNLVGGRKDQLAMLTIAERRVAKLVAEGLSNGEIAAALGKSVTTVKSQLGAIFSKLDIRSRTQLAAALRSV
jgi:DNA-binding CsgD family transcriptional regulator